MPRTMDRRATLPITRRRFVQGLGGSALLGSTGALWSEATTRPKSVLILGAGLSGLYAARLLEAAGCDVTVLEGRQRVGGRLHTIRRYPGLIEAGSQIAGESYRRLATLADELDVEYESHPGGRSQTAYFVGGAPWSPERGAELGLTEEESQVPPSRLQGLYLAREIPLQGARDWLTGDHGELDRLSIAGLMRLRGASEAAIRLAEVQGNCPSLEQASALWAVRNLHRRLSGPSGGIKVFSEGTDQLPKRMAAALRRPVWTGMVVETIVLRHNQVTAWCSDGSRFEADYAVCTLPFSVLRRLRVDPPFEGRQAEAVAELPYTPITRVVLQARRPFWEEDGLPATMWTDSPLERVFSNHTPDIERWGHTCWTDGQAALDLAAMPARRRARFIQDELARLRPSSQGAIEVGDTVSWSDDPFARGAYHSFDSGQISRFASSMAKPWFRLHLAGEHTSVEAPGMEGALESGERAAHEILEEAV